MSTALEKPRARRFGSAAQMSAALQQALHTSCPVVFDFFISYVYSSLRYLRPIYIVTVYSSLEYEGCSNFCSYRVKTESEFAQSLFKCLNATQLPAVAAEGVEPEQRVVAYLDKARPSSPTTKLRKPRPANLSEAPPSGKAYSCLRMCTSAPLSPDPQYLS